MREQSGQGYRFPSSEIAGYEQIMFSSSSSSSDSACLRCVCMLSFNVYMVYFKCRYPFLSSSDVMPLVIWMRSICFLMTTYFDNKKQDRQTGHTRTPAFRKQ